MTLETHNDQTFTCSICGEEHPLEVRTEFDGEELCPLCLEDETVLCSRCGDRLWRRDNAGSEDTPLCEDCYDDYYTHCVHCGTLLRNEDARYDDEDEDDEDPMCDHCYTRYHRSQKIHNYSYKPEPYFYGDGPRFFGVELEIDGGGERSDHAQVILETANRNGLEHVYCKHDGSLDDGFEIVTHPMSLAYHMKEMPWRAVLHEAINMGYTSHQARTCGLHIHVSRAAFGNSEEEQEAAIARVLYFFEKHWEELLKFSRRTPRQLEHWAARYGFKNQPKEILDHAKKGYGGRYTCVNLENRDTIEFRIFRGTLKYNTLIAALQLVNRICDAAYFMSDDELREMSWTTFASGCTQPELVQYLKERRLYVNEPVEDQEVEI